MHKILEILAVIKKAEQDGIRLVSDDIIGEIDCSSYDLDTIIKQVYNHYSTANSHHNWTQKDYKDCHAWVYKAIEFNGGMFDPRNKLILCPEQHFDFPIEKDWAKYSFDTPNGVIDGNLSLKGTIDLITLANDKTIEIIDWKSGKRLDWATGEEKTIEKLEKDPQLKIYHYAISKLYPHIEHIIFSIYFVNDGGPFSICFDKKDLQSTEDMLRQKFNTIKNVKKPKLNRCWMCSKLCHFGKTTFENTTIDPLMEYRDNQVTPFGKYMTKCEQIRHEVELHGMDHVLKYYGAPNHTFGSYKAPGSTQ